MTLSPVWPRPTQPLIAEAFPDDPGATWDVCVVGAGLTGVTTALLLARAGCSVLVLEAHHLGSGTTGASTAKVSLLQGTTLSTLRRRTSAGVVQAYVTGNLEAQAWLERYAEEHAVAFQRRTAYTYATSAAGARSVRDELDAAQAAGLPATWASGSTLPFPLSGAVALPGQFQVDPVELLTSLAREAADHGVRFREGVTATTINGDDPVVVSTDQGEYRADRVVVATNLPFLDRGGFFARAEPGRSYAMAFATPSPAVDGMYLSADSPTRSLRDAPAAVSPEAGEGSLLLVGGNGHVTGRVSSPAARLAELRAWTEGWFPEARFLTQWAAQDYVPADRVPWAGPVLPGQDEVLVAGGYGKWGMTNAVAAALALSARILGGTMDWAEDLYSWRPRAGGAAEVARINALVGREMAKGWTLPLVHPGRREPAEGEGVVTYDHLGAPTAAARTDGTVHRMSAVCPHLGGILRWNDAERSWDCPLHGSRFSARGERLEGPATCGLSARR
jgi:glycine/D-amino acid oxidase-like deaminating enzyme/nitrite reductase/ring-hydroxylating ferredoxin subunit